MGFILPRVFPVTVAARPDAAPSALELLAGPLPRGSEPAPPHGVLTYGEGGVFSLENADPSEVYLLDSLADSKRTNELGYEFPETSGCGCPSLAGPLRSTVAPTGARRGRR